MQTIWKYTLVVTDEQTVSMPFGAKILCVQMQHDSPCLWAMCKPALTTEIRKIRVIGTGHPIDDLNLSYIGTFQMEDGRLVFHVFEAK